MNYIFLKSNGQVKYYMRNISEKRRIKVGKNEDESFNPRRERGMDCKL